MRDNEFEEDGFAFATQNGVYAAIPGKVKDPILLMRTYVNGPLPTSALLWFSSSDPRYSRLFQAGPEGIHDVLNHDFRGWDCDVRAMVKHGFDMAYTHTDQATKEGVIKIFRSNREICRTNASINCLCSHGDALYAAGSSDNSDSGGIYRIGLDGSIEQVATRPSPVLALCSGGGKLYDAGKYGCGNESVEERDFFYGSLHLSSLAWHNGELYAGSSFGLVECPLEDFDDYNIGIDEHVVRNFLSNKDDIYDPESPHWEQVKAQCAISDVTGVYSDDQRLVFAVRDVGLFNYGTDFLEEKFYWDINLRLLDLHGSFVIRHFAPISSQRLLDLGFIHESDFCLI